MNIPTIIALTVIGAFFVFVIGCVVYRKLLTNIDISFQDRIYTYGDEVTGKVTICAKKSIEIESMRIVLNCIKFHRQENAGTVHSTVYEDVVEYKERFLLRRGAKRTFDFSLKLPEADPITGLSQTVNLSDAMLPIAKHISNHNIRDYFWSVGAIINVNNVKISDGKRLLVDGYTIDDRLKAHKEAKKHLNEKLFKS